MHGEQPAIFGAARTSDEGSHKAAEGEYGGDDCELVGVHGDALREARVEGGACDALLLAGDDILRGIELGLYIFS